MGHFAEDYWWLQGKKYTQKTSESAGKVDDPTLFFEDDLSEEPGEEGCGVEEEDSVSKPHVLDAEYC